MIMKTQTINFKIVIFTAIIGSILFTIFSYYIAPDLAQGQNETYVFWSLVFSGIIFSFIWGYAFAFYIRWIKRQKLIMIFLSTLFYPITLVVFYMMAVFCMIPYTVKAIWLKYRQRNIA